LWKKATRTRGREPKKKKKKKRFPHHRKTWLGVSGKSDGGELFLKS